MRRAIHRWKNQGLKLENYLLKLKILKLNVSKTAALKKKVNYKELLIIGKIIQENYIDKFYMEKI